MPGKQFHVLLVDYVARPWCRMVPLLPTAKTSVAELPQANYEVPSGALRTACRKNSSVAWLLLELEYILNRDAESPGDLEG